MRKDTPPHTDTNSTNHPSIHPPTYRPGLRPLRALLGLSLLLAAWWLPQTAQAHKVGVSKGSYTPKNRNLTITWDMARGDLLGLVDGLDANKDQKLSAKELEKGRAQVEKTFLAQLLLTRQKKPCEGSLHQLKLLTKDGVHVQLHYHCEAANGPIQWDLKLLQSLPYGHRHLAAIQTAKGPRPVIFSRRHTQHTLGAQDISYSTVGSFLLMGIEHILIGWDHLLFLFALILLGGTFRNLLGVITAFTIAHSITLSIAALGLWVPSSRWVEALIALSVAYVGIENLFVKKIDHRWKLTFFFGLIHGFGFAGVLSEIGLPPQGEIASLLLFNLGVEVGQVFVMALLLPIILWAHKREWLNLRSVRALSAAVVLVGLFWFVQRIS